jgi:hypothetical protein
VIRGALATRIERFGLSHARRVRARLPAAAGCVVNPTNRGQELQGWEAVGEELPEFQ